MSGLPRHCLQSVRTVSCGTHELGPDYMEAVSVTGGLRTRVGANEYEMSVVCCESFLMWNGYGLMWNACPEWNGRCVLLAKTYGILTTNQSVRRYTRHKAAEMEMAADFFPRSPLSSWELLPGSWSLLSTSVSAAMLNSKTLSTITDLSAGRQTRIRCENTRIQLGLISVGGLSSLCIG